MAAALTWRDFNEKVTTHVSGGDVQFNTSHSALRCLYIRRDATECRIDKSVARIAPGKELPAPPVEIELV